MIVLVLIALLLGAPPQTDALSQRCLDEAQSQGEMNRCVAAEWRRADSALNSAYRALMARIRADEGFMATKDGRARGDVLLRDVQRAWIIQRDKLCQLQAYAVRGGSLEPLMLDSCRAQFTRERTAWLESINPPEDGGD